MFFSLLQVSWIRKPDLHILTMGTVVYTTDRRIAAEYIKDSGGWILRIAKAQVDDSGVYECQINTEPKKSKAYRLKAVGKQNVDPDMIRRRLK